MNADCDTETAPNFLQSLSSCPQSRSPQTSGGRMPGRRTRTPPHSAGQEFCVSCSFLPREIMTAGTGTTRNFSTRALSARLMFLAEASIHRLYEHIRRPGARVRAISRIVVPGRMGGFHLLQRHTFLNHILNAVANNDHHFLVVDDVGLIAQPSMTRNHVRAAFLLLGGNRDLVDKAIQRVDDSLDAATLFQVDGGIARRRENIARAYDIGAAKKNEAVSIRMRRGLMKDLNRIAVKEKVLLICRECVGWPGSFGRG